MVQVNVHEAKTHLSRLLARVAMGEEVVISKAGRPVARLVPVDGPRKRRVLGQDRGKDFWIAPDFDEYIPPGFEPYLPKTSKTKKSKTKK